MFEQEKTSEIMSFLNSLFLNGQISEFNELCEDAISELELRNPMMAKLYRFRKTFETEQDVGI